MMRIGIVLLLFVCSYVGLGQSKTKRLKFSEYEHDFSYIKEADGAAEHKFVFVNNGSDSTKIIIVQNDCKCIASDYTNSTIAPRDTGYVNVSFDPSDPINKEFKKKITVKALNDTVTLTVKGHIIPKHRSQSPAVYTKHIGDTWFRSNYVQMQYLYSDEVKEKAFDVYNSSDSTIELKFESLPNHVKVHPSSLTLKPKEVGDFLFTYDAKLKGEVSYVVDTFYLVTDEDTLSRKTLYVSANIAERFPEDIDTTNIPKLEANIIEVDFKTMKKNSFKSDTFFIKNVGTDTLYIRKMVSPCTCIKLTKVSQVDYILPNQEAKILATFHSDSRKGNMKKVFYIYTNDPTQPITEFRIRVYITK